MDTDWSKQFEHLVEETRKNDLREPTHLFGSPIEEWLRVLELIDTYAPVPVCGECCRVLKALPLDERLRRVLETRSQ